MLAEIISVGTELLLGHTINKDAAIIAMELSRLGIDLLNCQVVGDNRCRLMDALKLALSRSDVVITTGGLGPTKDDMTKEAVAELAGLPLIYDAESLEALKEYFGSRAMSENQKKQALVPKGAIVFKNMAGTAPGCAVPFPNGKYVVLFPGPPRELTPMLECEARPFFLGLGKEAIVSVMVKTFGIGEGAAAERLAPFFSMDNPTVAPYAGQGEMFLRVTAKAESEDDARRIAMPVAEKISTILGDVVYGLDVSSLEEAVVRQLAKRGWSISTAESCTGGLLAKRITDQPGASAVFKTGLIVYANEAKERLLDIPSELLSSFGAVSSQVAKKMAENARIVNQTDIGLGITGIAGPTGGSEEKPLGLVYIAMSAPDAEWLRVMKPCGRYLGRNNVRWMAASHALDMVRRYLAGLPPESCQI